MYFKEILFLLKQHQLVILLCARFSKVCSKPFYFSSSFSPLPSPLLACHRLSALQSHVILPSVYVIRTLNRRGSQNFTRARPAPAWRRSQKAREIQIGFFNFSDSCLILTVEGVKYCINHFTKFVKSYLYPLLKLPYVEILL